MRPLIDSDLRLARIFSRIAACGGLAAAEEELGVGLSTLSRQLQAFEARVGMVLCQRGRGGFALTADGVEVLAHIEKLLQASDDFATHLAGMGAAVGGKLKIGMIDCSAGDPQNPLGRILAHVQRNSPNVVLDVVIGAPKELERKVLDDKLHFAMFPEYWLHDGLGYHRLYREKVGLFAAPDHPAAKLPAPTKALIQKFPLIHRSLPEPPDLQRRKAGFPEGTRVEATEAVLSLVKAGCYIGFLPVHLATAAKLTELLPEVFGYALPMCLIHRKNRPPSRLQQSVLRAVDRICPAAQE